ncbi:AMIN-like domain-containing (lipo)protein [Geodermatophilus sp. URMC 61]|uniref:AMIN-like domain-containing (lipo)protein n=1 Tax=Geodermatophilus sp. URMC 61 TaxID=3423411 RepID=UPI00406D0D22
MIRRAAVCPPLLLAAALLAACGSGDRATSPSASTGEASSSSSASSAPTSAAPGTAPEETGADVPPFEGDTQPATREASADALLTVSDIRTGRQDGYDRVVLEMGGTGTPGWDVRYVDRAYSQGTGEPVEVAGEAVLQVTITGAGYPFDTGVEEWAGPDPLPGDGTQTVTEVAWDATFEGTSVAFVGTTGEAPFRVYALEDPTRVVVEVADLG